MEDFGYTSTALPADYSLADRIVLNTIWDTISSVLARNKKYVIFSDHHIAHPRSPLQLIEWGTTTAWICVFLQWAFTYTHPSSILPPIIYFIIAIGLSFTTITWNVAFSRARRTNAGNLLTGRIFYVSCNLVTFAIILISSTTFLLGPSLTLCSIICCNTLTFIWQWRLFYSNETLFPFYLFGTTEAMITSVVIQVITMIMGPAIWQYVWELRAIGGIQISHIFYLFVFFYTMAQSIAWVRTGLHIRRNRNITVFWDESVSISPKELFWVIIWASGAMSWCYSSVIFYSIPRPFLFSVHLSFAILLNHCITQRQSHWKSGNLYHPVLLIFFIPTTNNLLLFSLIDEVILSYFMCIILLAYWVYQSGKVRPREVSIPKRKFDEQSISV